MNRVPARIPPAFPVTPIAATPGTDVYGAMPGPARHLAQRFLEDDWDYTAWAARRSPKVAAAVQLAGCGAATLGVLRAFAQSLKSLNPAALKTNLAERKAKAELEAKLVHVRQQDSARQTELLAIKEKAPDWLKDELILVPGGLFMMGAKDLNDDSKLVHPVWVSAYLMLSTHVTNAMWKAKMDTDPSAKCGNEFRPDDHPVVGVSRDDALAYLVKVQQELTDLGIRAQVLLPTEAQWERAAKADQDFAYGTDDGTLSHNKAIYGGNQSKYTRHTAPVRSRSANPLGFYGLCGNAWEWCRDGWKRVYNSELQIDPMSDPVSAELYVSRGGSWYSNYPQFLRAAYRDDHHHDRRNDDRGFRLVVAPRTPDL